MLTLGRKKKRLQQYDLQEIATGGKVRVDRENHVIRGVKLLGLESVNNATYQDFALADGKNLYEGADCYFDHPGKPTTPRGYGDKFGRIRGVYHEQGIGLFGDIHYNPKHNLSEQALWDAENSPDSFGMSPNHRVQARTGPDGRKVVEKITRVRSVDIVSNAATTQSLFEHEEESAMSTITELLKKATPYGAKFADLLESDGVDVTAPIDVLGEMKPAEAVEDALAQTALAIFKDETVSPEETGTQIAELAAIVVDVKAKVEPGSTPPAEEAPAEEKADESSEDKTDEAPAELPAKEKEDEEEKTEGRLEKSLLNLTSAVSGLVKRDQARSVLESASVPVSGTLLTELMECEDEPAMVDMVESWPGRKRGIARPSLRGAPVHNGDIPKDKAGFKNRYILK